VQIIAKTGHIELAHFVYSSSFQPIENIFSMFGYIFCEEF